MEKCMVCEELTSECVPSPFFPYSGFRCKNCQEKHRIPHEDLLAILIGEGTAKNYNERHKQWVEWWGKDDGYLEKYINPTLDFFHITKEKFYGK